MLLIPSVMERLPRQARICRSFLQSRSGLCCPTDPSVKDSVALELTEGGCGPRVSWTWLSPFSSLKRPNCALLLGPAGSSTLHLMFNGDVVQVKWLESDVRARSIQECKDLLVFLPRRPFLEADPSPAAFRWFRQLACYSLCGCRGRFIA